MTKKKAVKYFTKERKEKLALNPATREKERNFFKNITGQKICPYGGIAQG